MFNSILMVTYWSSFENAPRDHNNNKSNLHRLIKRIKLLIIPPSPQKKKNNKKSTFSRPHYDVVLLAAALTQGQIFNSPHYLEAIVFTLVKSTTAAVESTRDWLICLIFVVVKFMNTYIRTMYVVTNCGVDLKSAICV